MTHAVSRDELEAQFSGRVTLVAALLEDLAKCVPAAVTLAEDATLEDAFELHDSNARSVRQIFLDSTEALEDSDALRKEMKAFSETLDQVESGNIPEMVRFDQQGHKVGCELTDCP